MNRTARTIATTAGFVAATVILTAVAAPGQALAEGKPRWEAAVVTVHVADEAAWAGTDVQAALDAWSPALAMTLTDDPGADVTLTSARSAGIEGATAYRDGEGSRITSCRVELAPKYAGTEQGATLAHELGHCLGLSHNNLGASSVMYWIEGGEHFSPTVRRQSATSRRRVRQQARAPTPEPPMRRHFTLDPDSLLSAGAGLHCRGSLRRTQSSTRPERAAHLPTDPTTRSGGVVAVSGPARDVAPIRVRPLSCSTFHWSVAARTRADAPDPGAERLRATCRGGDVIPSARATGLATHPWENSCD